MHRTDVRMDPVVPMDAKNRAHRDLENRGERGFPQRPHAFLFQEEERTERKPSTSSTHEIPDSPFGARAKFPKAPHLPSNTINTVRAGGGVKA